MTIKGQNLRLFVGDSVVAASTSCTLHTAAQVEDSSTKDSDGDWTENEVVGLSWDVSVDALVTDGYLLGGVVKCTTASGKTPAYYKPTPLRLRAGDTITLTSPSSTTLALFNADTMASVTSSSSVTSKTYTASADITVVIGCSNSSLAITYAVEDDATGFAALYAAMEARQPVAVTFAGAEGTRNREQGDVWLSGSALITDLSITAANRQNSTYTCQLTGVGELALGE